MADAVNDASWPEPDFIFRRPTDPGKERRQKAEDVLVATLIGWVKENRIDHWKDQHLISEAFPTVPERFVLAAQLELDTEAENAFLDDLANTIEGHLARRALEGGGAD